MSRREQGLITLLFIMVLGGIIYFMADFYLDVKHVDIDEKIVEVEMEKLLNEYRIENSLNKLKHGTWLDKGAHERASEMAMYGSHRYMTSSGEEKSHTRPDGSSWDTLFTHLQGTQSKARYLSENIALIQIHKRKDEKWLAEAMFKAWKESPSHNEAMLSKENKSFSFKVAKIPLFVESENREDGRDTYIGVQIFDTYSNVK